MPYASPYLPTDALYDEASGPTTTGKVRQSRVLWFDELDSNLDNCYTGGSCSPTTPNETSGLDVLERL